MTFGARLPEPGSPLVENSRADRRLFTANPFDERLQAAAPAPRPEKPLLDSLYARVFATPDDDAPRMVLADHLSELGDPRGEFIAIQLAEPDGPTGLAKGRIKELKRHFDAWLPAGVERSTAVFRRGFLHACRWIAPTDASHREWRTVEELECSGARGAADFYRGRLFASDALPRLRTLRRAEATAFAALASGPVRERLAMLHTFHLPFDELRGRSGALAHHFPELHTLDLEGTALPTDGLAFLCEVLELRATKRVRSAVQRLRLDDPDARLRLREAPELVRAAPGLAVSVYTDVERLCCVEFSGGRVRLCHRGSVSTHLLEQLVARAQREGLPSTLTRVEEIS
ncbi:MAG: TIGR02996 domain-containing protein [Archangium sp.]|nr:TIGR02996 domain-containing protein [Archangium sp.]